MGKKIVNTTCERSEDDDGQRVIIYCTAHGRVSIQHRKSYKNDKAFKSGVEASWKLHWEARADS